MARARWRPESSLPLLLLRPLHLRLPFRRAGKELGRLRALQDAHRRHRQRLLERRARRRRGPERLAAAASVAGQRRPLLHLPPRRHQRLGKERPRASAQRRRRRRPGRERGPQPAWLLPAARDGGDPKGATTGATTAAAAAPRCGQAETRSAGSETVLRPSSSRPGPPLAKVRERRRRMFFFVFVFFPRIFVK